MAYDVRTERAGPRPLAAIHAQLPPDGLGAGIIGLLDKIWPLLRAQGARTGHNVVIYDDATDGMLTCDVGVEVPDGFNEHGEVRATATPSGEVATVAHFGEYSQLAPAYRALDRWCADNGRTRAGVSWEVYGDWADDPAKRRTDLYYLLG